MGALVCGCRRRARRLVAWAISGLNAVMTVVSALVLGPSEEGLEAVSGLVGYPKLKSAVFWVPDPLPEDELREAVDMGSTPHTALRGQGQGDGWEAVGVLCSKLVWWFSLGGGTRRARVYPAVLVWLRGSGGGVLAVDPVHLRVLILPHRWSLYVDSRPVSPHGP